MPIVDPTNSASQSHDSLAQLDSATGLLAAAGDPIATSGGPEATVAPHLVQGLRRDLTDQSGTIASGGVAQTLMAANPTRAYLLIENVDPSEDLWIDFTADAVVGQPSILIAPRSGFVMDGFVSGEAVSVIAATTSHPFSAREA
jgi:hypothetical protein